VRRPVVDRPSMPTPQDVDYRRNNTLAHPIVDLDVRRVNLSKYGQTSVSQVLILPIRPVSHPTLGRVRCDHPSPRMLGEGMIIWEVWYK
jgi:hypothetical protein